MSANLPRPIDTGASSPHETRKNITVASFAPVTLSNVPASFRQRSTILVHQKSPLLVATPPQITRALAYSHPFLLPLNKLVGLLSWTTGDPWESFLMLALFWVFILYGGLLIRWGAPVSVVGVLVLAMYSRRYSPLSSSGWPYTKTTYNKSKSEVSGESIARHQKSLDEIVETLNTFTSRCSVLLDPMITFTDFLSTQQSATSSTTRPALTTLFVRILLLTPLWIALTLPPLRLFTTQRVILSVGTLVLTWHSRPARISRAILWRSLTIRHLCTLATGLCLSPTPPNDSPATAHLTSSATIQPSKTTPTPTVRDRPLSPGVRFTFVLFENQRRWLGLGWTHSLFAYERTPWTDEHLNPAPPKDAFILPVIEGGATRWRWAQGSEWLVEGAAEGEEGAAPDKKSKGEGGWIYYDNKWRDGRRNLDSWGRYTRRRKWYRDAEMVETSEITSREHRGGSREGDRDGLTEADRDEGERREEVAGVSRKETSDTASTISTRSSVKKRKWFGNGRVGTGDDSQRSSKTSVDLDGAGSVDGEKRERDMEREKEWKRDEADVEEYESIRHGRERDGDWGVGDDAEMGLS